MTMNTKPTLLILAAGMGSRYGGLKQLDQFGPNGEAIIHYSIYDALKAGFGKFVFVIRRDIEDQFKTWIKETLPADLNYELVYQERLSEIPQEYIAKTQGREKPWGTGHAILVAKQAVTENFAVINGDDYYGQESFQIMADSLRQQVGESQYAMVGFKLQNTLSENGSVSRGICRVTNENTLQDVEEHTGIEQTETGIMDTDSNPPKSLSADSIVSLNFWGFSPSVFGHLSHKFNIFMQNYQGEPKKEFFIPFVVDELIKEGVVKVDVLSTPNSWFGVTYTQDKQYAIDEIQRMINDQKYPTKLF